MENSQAYIDFTNQIKSTGSQKMAGYNSKTLDEIFEWEREEVENLIWHNFCNNDIDLAIFLPKLKKYNGLYSLERKLQELNVPSSGSVLISRVLYENTRETKYLDSIMRNIETAQGNIPFVANLAYCSPSEKAYSLLVHIYINNDNEVIRSTAVTGILYNKGIIKNPNDLQEITNNVGLKRKFISDDIDARKKNIKLFE
nr:hypothetical protein [uncultured Anaerosporobacter sp.]